MGMIKMSATLVMGFHTMDLVTKHVQTMCLVVGVVVDNVPGSSNFRCH
jgi:hypothetical protein